MAAPAAAKLPALTKEKARAVARERFHETPEGRRMNLWAILHKYCIGAPEWNRRQSLGWTALGGSPVDVVSMPVPGKDGATEPTYLEADVAKVFRKQFPVQVVGGQWIDTLTFKPAGSKRTYSGWRKAWSTFGVPAHQFRRAVRENKVIRDYNADESLTVLRVQSWDGRPASPVVLDGELIAIARNFRKRTASKTNTNVKPFEVREGDLVWHCLPNRAMIEHLAKVAKKKVARDWCKEWSRKPSALDPKRKALRHVMRPNPYRMGWSEIPWYFVEDALTIVAGRESPHRTPMTAEERLEKAKVFLRGYLRETGQFGRPVQGAVAAFADGGQVKQGDVGFLREAADALEVTRRVKRSADNHERVWYWCLPGQGLPEPGDKSEVDQPAASSQETPGQAKKAPSAFIPTDLQKKILHALDGKAMTADALEFKLKVDRRRLYYGGGTDRLGGLKELCDIDRVAQARRIGGYYRPDSPPA